MQDNTQTKNWKTKIGSFLSNFGSGNLFFLIVLIGGLLYIRNCRTPKVITTQPTVMQPLEQKKDKEGGTYAILPTNVVSKEIMKFKMDSIAKAIKADMINQYSQWKSETDTQFHDIPVVTTADGEDSMTHEDNYITLSAKMKNGKGSFKLKGIDTTTYIDATTKRFLRADRRDIQLSNASPYNKITQGTNITLYQPKTIVTIGPSVGYAWTLQNGKPVGGPMVGITATMNIIPIIKSKK